MGNAKNVVVVLVGKSGAGKDSLAKAFAASEKNFKLAISTTSRPIRTNEQEGVDYYFIDHEDFMLKVVKGLIWDPKIYWTYAPTLVQKGYGLEKDKNKLLEENYIVAADLERLEILKKKLGNRVIAVYVQCDADSRKERAKLRDQNFSEEEWFRRKVDEDRLFHAIEDKIDYTIYNYDFSEALKELKKLI